MTDDREVKLKEELSAVSLELDELQSQIDSLLELRSELSERKRSLEERLRSCIDGKKLSCDWGSDDFEWSKRLREILTSTFRLKAYRHLQKESINATMSGLDCLLVMPTGGGKSLCYQLPAVAAAGSGVTLVISPLLSLMEDQVMTLKKLGVAAEMLSASSSKEQVAGVQADLVTSTSKLRLVYVTPEKMARSKRFLFKLEKCYEQKRLLRIAIDEVHCCSQWGHDFRPDYKFLGVLKRQFSGVPIIGLTATATGTVLDDVKSILNIPHAIVFRAPYNRPNLFYEVLQKPSSHEQCIAQIAELIRTRFKDMSGIVYCLSKKDAENVASDLSKLSVRAMHYHADVSPDHRSRVHSLWLRNSVQVIVATIAFGMGIDKPDVRFVIHHSLSKSMENYYQESGRAGRDDREAHCIVYYRFGDLFRQSCMVFTERTGLEKLYGMLAYCHNPQADCRRKLIASQFAEAWESNQCKDMCDCCNNRNTALATEDLSSFCLDIFQILDVAAAKDQRLTALKLADLWLDGQSKERRRRSKATGGGNSEQTADRSRVWPLSREDCETALAHLLLHGRLKEDFHFTPYSTFSYLVKGGQSDKVNISIPLTCRSSLLLSNAEGAATSSRVQDVLTDRPESSVTRTKRRKNAAKNHVPARSIIPAVVQARETEIIDILSDSSVEDDIFIASKRHCPSPNME